MNNKNSNVYKINETTTENDVEIDDEITVITTAPTASRRDLQFGRRFFHCSAGVIIATFYSIFLSHQQMIYFLGTSACILYLLEQVRINYPELKVSIINHYFLRAEEQLKESAAIPYVMAVLLTIISFPKPIALVAIFTLAIADPLSAIIGIRFGKHHIVKNKSLEGSFAFFVVVLITVMTVISPLVPAEMKAQVWLLAVIIAMISTAIEMIPLKLDDNLTIPLSTAFVLWIHCALFSIPI